MTDKPEPDQEDDETAYLMRSPANAERVLASIERLEDGQGCHHELAE